MQDDARQQSEGQIESSKYKRWNDQLNDPCICRLIRVPSVSRCKDDCLQNHCAADECLAFPESLAYECCRCQRRGAKQALFPESSLCRLRDRRKRWQIVREHV